MVICPFVSPLLFLRYICRIDMCHKRQELGIAGERVLGCSLEGGPMFILNLFNLLKIYCRLLGQ